MYDEIWRRHRKWYQQVFIAKNALDGYRPLQRREATRMLFELLKDPSGYRHHLKCFVVAVVLGIGYGRSISSTDNEFIRLVDRDLGQALEGAGSGSTLNDFFPVLRFLPSWFPGAEFQKIAARAWTTIRMLENRPFAKVKEELSLSQGH